MPAAHRPRLDLDAIDAALAWGEDDDDAAEAALRAALDDRRTDLASGPAPAPRPECPERPTADELGLPACHEPPGYRRDRAGRWRYADGGALVPGARDVTLARLWRFPREGPYLLVPVLLAGTSYRPGAAAELAWCVGCAHGETDTGAVAGVARRCGPRRRAWRVPVAEWDRRADVPLGLDAPELAADRLWDVARIAAVTGVEPATVRGYVRRGYLPAPTVRRGGVPLWSAPVVVQALERRPGQGVRTAR